MASKKVAKKPPTKASRKRSTAVRNHSLAIGEAVDRLMAKRDSSDTVIAIEAVRLDRDIFRGEQAERVMVLSGDQVYVNGGAPDTDDLLATNWYIRPTVMRPIGSDMGVIQKILSSKGFEFSVSLGNHPDPGQRGKRVLFLDIKEQGLFGGRGNDCLVRFVFDCVGKFAGVFCHSED